LIKSDSKGIYNVKKKDLYHINAVSKLSIQIILKKSRFPKILSRTTVFNIDNNNKYFL